ncbi:MAG: GerAB/ArcD/ProY family transporter, partial [Clostridia bacterium]
MPEEAITNRQAATLAVTFIICNAYSLIYGTSSGRDVWIAYIAATILAIFVWSLATRRMERSPGKSFFAIVELSFGRIFGRVIIVTLVLFALLSCTTSIGLFTRAAQLTALSKTPQIILPLAMLLCAAWSLYGGLSVIARTASLLFYFSIATFLYFLLSGLPLLDLRNIMPIMSHNLLNTARSALSVFTNEFGDMILLLAMYTEIKR